MVSGERLGLKENVTRITRIALVANLRESPLMANRSTAATCQPQMGVLSSVLLVSGR